MYKMLLSLNCVYFDIQDFRNLCRFFLKFDSFTILINTPLYVNRLMNLGNTDHQILSFCDVNFSKLHFHDRRAKFISLSKTCTFHTLSCCNMKLLTK